MHRLRAAWLTLGAFLFTSCAGPTLYWTDAETGTIERREGGDAPVVLVDGLRSPRGVAVDVERRAIFFTDPARLGSDPHAQVERADLQGGSRAPVYRTNGTFAVEGVAVNPTLGRLYFAQNGLAGGPGEIWWARIEPPHEPRPLVTGDLEDPRDVAVDAATSRLYWSDSALGSISSVNAEGGDRRELMIGSGAPFGIAIDPDRRRIYWTDARAGEISFCDLDACTPESLADGLDQPISIELDPERDRIYWTELRRGRIMRMRVDGAGGPEEVVSALRSPHGLALIPE